MKKITDSGLLDRQKEDKESFDFEEIYQRFEKMKLMGKISDDEADTFESILSELDIHFQELLEKSDNRFAKESFTYTETIIKQWLPGKLQMIGATNMKVLTNNLRLLKDEIVSATKPSVILLNRIDHFSKIVIDPNKDIYIKSIVRNLPRFTRKYFDDKSIPERFSIIDTPGIPFKPKYYWDIEINFTGESFSAAMIAEFLLVFSSSLESVEGCAITIEEMKTGSVKIKLRAWFKDIKSKEDTKKIIELGRRSAIGYVEKVATENDQIKKETEKTQAEIDLLNKQIENLPNDLLLEREKLLNEKLKAEVDQIKIDNIKKRLEVVNQISDLYGKNLIKPQNVEILMNNILYFEKDENKISIGEGMDIIDNETKKLK